MKAMLSEQEKIYILTNYERKTLGKLSEELKRCRSTIYKFYRKWQATKTILNLKHKCGRRKILNTAQEKLIEELANKNPRLELLELKKKLHLNCSVSTISRSLKKLGFKNLRLRHKPIITEIQKVQRLQFARKYSSWTIRKWKKVLFSDESSVQIGKIYPRKIWLKPENRWKPGFYLPKKKEYGKKYIKVWSCFSYNGVGKLQFIESGWNRHTYKGILNENLKIEAERLIGKDYVFQEDGDKVHKSKVAETWKRKNKIQVLDWPPSSGDLSPIENLWIDFKRRLSYENNPTNIEQFKLLASRIWNETKVSTCKTLIESMKRRMKAVLSNHGGTTKY